MLIESKKTVKLEELERQKLREALEIVEKLFEEIDEEEIRYTKESLETLIYSDGWEKEVWR